MKKMGGRPHRENKSFDFISCMDSCVVVDAGFVGPKFTWCNNWRPEKRVWKRLDRILINDTWTQRFQNNFVRHLGRTGSDHRPILLRCQNDQGTGVNYFKFLNFWVDQPGFFDLVQQIWDTRIDGNAIWQLQQRLKTLGGRLSTWSREIIGDVHQNFNE